MVAYVQVEILKHFPGEGATQDVHCILVVHARKFIDLTQVCPTVVHLVRID